MDTNNKNQTKYKDCNVILDLLLEIRWILFNFEILFSFMTIIMNLLTRFKLRLPFKPFQNAAATIQYWDTLKGKNV